MRQLARSIVVAAAVATTAAAQDCCQIEAGFQMIWSGADSTLTYHELAAYCAPILWFSPDEPNLEGTAGKDIRIPTNFPFEPDLDRPLVYYRVRTLLTRAGDRPVILREDPRRVDTELDLSRLVGIDLDYFFYYPTEEGLGAHKHDVEATYFKLYVHHCVGCDVPHYALYIERSIAKAHGLQWYDNTLVTDAYTEFPMTILVEEGKHASCTDKNHDGVYAPDNAIFALRPFPRPGDVDTVAEPTLIHFVDDKGDENWPEVLHANDVRAVTRWLDEERFINSLSIAWRHDGQNFGDRSEVGGLSFLFPLLILKNVSDPIAGGWFVNRIYLKDKKLRDISWNVLYTSSASRWVDGYFAVGWEWDEDEDGNVHTDMMTETGVKFRLNMSHTPLKFLSKLGTDFWGVRVGVKNKGIFNWDSIGYCLEVGAGVW